MTNKLPRPNHKRERLGRKIEREKQKDTNVRLRIE
jgi:hypothetical protein